MKSRRKQIELMVLILRARSKKRRKEKEREGTRGGWDGGRGAETGSM